jgi:hypothetical protein
VKKLAIVFILTLSLLLSFASLAAAEVLFGVTAETGPSDFSLNYQEKGGYATEYHGAGVDDISASPNMITMTADINLFLIRLAAEYGYGDVGKGATFSNATIKAGWDIGLPLVTVQLYGGYQAYTLTHGDSADSLSLGDSAYWDLFGSLGLQTGFGPISIYANENFPLYCNFDNGVDSDSSASMNYFKAGISYAPLPFIDLFVDYRKMDAESKVMKLESDGYNFGVKISF